MIAVSYSIPCYCCCYWWCCRIRNNARCCDDIIVVVKNKLADQVILIARGEIEWWIFFFGWCASRHRFFSAHFPLILSLCECGIYWIYCGMHIFSVHMPSVYRCTINHTCSSLSLTRSLFQIYTRATKHKDPLETVINNFNARNHRARIDLQV